MTSPGEADPLGNSVGGLKWKGSQATRQKRKRNSGNNRPDMPATGAGETAITVVAGAIGIAIFDATGVRLRQIPFSSENVKAALTRQP
jgi:hypothetical protein